MNTYNLAGGRYIKSGYPGSMRGRFSRYFGPGTGEPRRGRESLKGPIALAIDVLFLFIFFFFFFFFGGGGIFNSNLRPKAVVSTCKISLGGPEDIYPIYCGHRCPVLLIHTIIEDNIKLLFSVIKKGGMF